MRFIFFLAGLLLTSPARSAAPPYDPSPYTATGVITGATLNNASDVLSGGTLTLNGFTVTIPRNLLVNTPSITAIAWSELFKPDRTINLPLWPQVSWEASIFANFIGGKYVAGLVYIFQELGNINQGFISHIDYDKGEIRVGGDSANPSTGARIVINDPVGRYGKVHGDWPIWTADTDNPSIVASTGFPVCVPRVDPAVADDPLCPKKNRPVDGAGKALSAFTFDAPPVAAGRPDPNFFAPLVVGDFITYSGTVVSDGLIAVYTLEANLGIYTAPGTSPAYIRIADLQAGVNGNPAGEIAETRVEGFTTDQTTTVTVFTIDVDPCTGEESERQWGTVVPRAAAVKGNFRFRSSATTLPPYTREVGVRISNPTVETPNGIIAGQYISPYGPDGFIFPELLTFGSPQLPLEFNLLPFLSQGSGPWVPGTPGVVQNVTGPIVGQLSPWPGLGQPALVNCPTVNALAPVANAGPDFAVGSGGIVNLIGSIKNAISTTGLAFSWSQLSGTSVTLNNSHTANASFTAPAVVAVTPLIFALNTTNSAGSSIDQVTVTINPTTIDQITFQQVTWKSGKGSGTLTVLASSNIASSSLFVSASTPDIAKTAMTSLGGGRWQALITIKPAPALVTVTSSLGASASSTVGKG